MSGPKKHPVGMAARLAPAVLAAVGLVLIGWVFVALLDPAGQETPIEIRLALLVPAVLLVLVGISLVIDPRPLLVRRALAGAAIVWLVFLAGAAVVQVGQGRLDAYLVAVAVLAAVVGGALLALALTTDDVSDESLPGPLGRLAATVVFSVAILVAGITLVLVATLATWALRSIQVGTIREDLPLWAAVLIVVLPFAAFGIASLDSRRAGRRDFRAQQAANRRDSLLLLVALIGVVAATVEVITAAVTFDPGAALVAAGVAAAVGVGAALGADRFGADMILETAGAKQANERQHDRLLNVVREVSLGANVPPPRVWVIEDGSMNAFATGRDPAHASLAVTSGLLTRLDREELQGVIGHEVGHIRNLDTRYALYVAVLVGLVALVTDGFLRLVIEGWRQGAFIWTGGDDAKETVAAFVSGILVGLFLLLLAAILRVVAPLFSLLVQAAVSREREYLADATSVELTRNPIGLERALAGRSPPSPTTPTGSRRGTAGRSTSGSGTR
ncbi:MAG: M48 family metalloprotease [Chloroflexi bacterium]|nr:M48 family metalloprotease [Chloroflexota bacterium]